MDIKELVKEKRDEILEIAKRHGAYNVRVFGSVAREGTDKNIDVGDVDILVDLEEKRSLFDHIALIHDLEDLLGTKVDVVTENSIYWLLRRRILKEARPL